jgi:MEDS: MEthanogen/methylotroph, DcmR Sensory domain/Histidine kinase-like ATPase domain
VLDGVTMPVGFLPAANTPHGHTAQFYNSEEELAQNAADYLYDALHAGGAAVIVSTPTRRAAIEALLTGAGVDVQAALGNGTVLGLDAAQTLGRFVVGGRPDRGLFRAVIGTLIRQARTTGGPVHVYGEMVDLLWQAGQVSSALDLEALWNELHRQLTFSLLCSYRSEFLADEDYADLFEELCWSHSAIMRDQAPTGSTQRGRSEPTETSRAFALDPRSPFAARRFVVDNLTGWANDGLLGDASLVVTELATNAVKHARSAFTVTVAPIDDRLRVSVRDAGTDRWMPSERALNGKQASGVSSARGLGLIAAVATKWGMRPLESGKVVWADLARQQRPASRMATSLS